MSAATSSSASHWWSGFELTVSEASGWLWGTVQGAFNEKASLSQIIVDAVIGMIPLVGDVTAVRDLIAVSIGMADSAEKRHDKLQWIMLVVLIFALIPVVGGVIKGVGRLTLKAVGEAAHFVGAARAAHMGQAAKDIVAFLNRIGVGNAERWLLRLRVLDHQAQIVERFGALVVTLRRACAKIKTDLHAVLPQALLDRLDAISKGLGRLKEAGDKMIPEALKELDQHLREIQSYIRSGGETTARTVEHAATAGSKTVTYADELRMIEVEAGALRSAKGGWAQNSARPGDMHNYYKHEAGYPDLAKLVDRDTGALTGIPAFAGKITHRPMKPGDEVFRLFGPEGKTFDEPVGESFGAGGWWGMGKPPKTAEEWRKHYAVLDEFNRDGFMVVGKVVEPDRIKACVGKVSEQTSKDIPGQFLPGGGMQAVFYLDDVAKKTLSEAGQAVIKTGKSQKLTVGGMELEIRPTGWTDANGRWGYVRMPGTTTVQTTRLGAREIARKDEEVPATRSAKPR